MEWKGLGKTLSESGTARDSRPSSIADIRKTVVLAENPTTLLDVCVYKYKYINKILACQKKEGCSNNRFRHKLI